VFLERLAAGFVVGWRRRNIAWWGDASDSGHVRAKVQWPARTLRGFAVLELSR
jgi:hypothetical protein